MGPKKIFANELPCVPSWPYAAATRKRLPSERCSHPHLAFPGYQPGSQNRHEYKSLIREDRIGTSRELPAGFVVGAHSPRCDVVLLRGDVVMGSDG